MRFLFSPYGRTNRVGYWSFIGIYVVATIISIWADRAFGTYDAELETGLIESLVALFFLWPSIAVSVRRLHDLGYSGWWVLWVILISTAILIGGFVFIGFAGLGADAFDALGGFDETAQFADLPVIFWVVIGAAVTPYLIQIFMLLFLPGEPGENRFDRKDASAAADSAASPPWGD